MHGACWHGCQVPPPPASSHSHRERGTASVELIATIPFLLLAIAVAAQFALAGQALWAASVAARAGARASLVGSNAERVARRALPASMRAEARVDASDGTSVEVRVPQALPWLPAMRVGARSELGAGG